MMHSHTWDYMLPPGENLCCYWSSKTEWQPFRLLEYNLNHQKTIFSQNSAQIIYLAFLCISKSRRCQVHAYFQGFPNIKVFIYNHVEHLIREKELTLNNKNHTLDSKRCSCHIKQGWGRRSDQYLRFCSLKNCFPKGSFFIWL